MLHSTDLATGLRISVYVYAGGEATDHVSGRSFAKWVILGQKLHIIRPQADDEGATASASEEERCEQLYDSIAWPLGKIYGHPYDAFKLALTCVLLCLLYFALI